MENSKLIGLSPIFLSIMLASNTAPKSRKFSLLFGFSWKTRKKTFILFVYHFIETIINVKNPSPEQRLMGIVVFSSTSYFYYK